MSRFVKVVTMSNTYEIHPQHYILQEISSFPRVPFLPKNRFNCRVVYNYIMILHHEAIKKAKHRSFGDSVFLSNWDFFQGFGVDRC